MFAWIRRRFLAPHPLRLTETLTRLEPYRGMCRESSMLAKAAESLRIETNCWLSVPCLWNLPKALQRANTLRSGSAGAGDRKPPPSVRRVVIRVITIFPPTISNPGFPA